MIPVVGITTGVTGRIAQTDGSAASIDTIAAAERVDAYVVNVPFEVRSLARRVGNIGDLLVLAITR
jgi:hypothetical protein